ncbi:MAG: hypothetical protein HQM01_14290 [Magnetococcales bacterium]|nr:hypothetical protein [Magnetococcales bacterium]
MTLYDAITTYAPIVISAASFIAAVTPTPSQGSPWKYLYDWIDILALNIGKAKDRGTGHG